MCRLDGPLGAEYFEYLPANLCLDFGGGGGYMPTPSTAGSTAAAQAIADAMNKYTELMKPYTDEGKKAVDVEWSLLDPNSGVDRTAYLRSTPGYQFQLGEGVNALDRSAANKGMLSSGAQSKALTKYGQGLADQTYNTYLGQIGNVANRGAGTGANLGNAYMSGANSLAGIYQNQDAINNQAAYNAYNASQRSRESQYNGLLGLGGLVAGTAANYFLPGSGILAGASSGGLTSGGYLNPSNYSGIFSDKRTKTNIKDMDTDGGNALMILDKLQPKTFDYKSEYGPPNQAGFVAQDLEKTIPEAVAKDNDGMRMVNPMAINALLVKAIQEQQGQIEELRNSLGLNRKIEGRQHGGPVNAMQPYVVGESGPEVIIPQQNAVVIPNQQIDPNEVLKSVLNEYPGLKRVHNPETTIAMFASPERLALAKKYAQTYSSTGDPGNLEYWPTDETGPEGFPHPTGGKHNVLELYKEELRNPDVLKPMIMGDLLHGMTKDPTFSKLRDEFKTQYSPEALKLIATRKGKDDFYSDDSTVDAFIRGGLVPYKGGNWLSQDKSGELYSPAQLQTLQKIKELLMSGGQ